MTQPAYDPHNPQPLSQMQTEPVWEGKYDEYGDRHSRLSLDLNRY